MNVYIETSFILEQSYLQEQHEWCQRILELGEAQRARLVMPAFCIGEAYSALVNRSKRRSRLSSQLTEELKELARSKPYASVRNEFLEITKLLSTSGREENTRLDDTLLRVVNSSVLIPIDQQTVKAAMDLQSTRNLQAPDSLVYASVLSHLHSESTKGPSCFVTKNARDFSDPDIEDDLRKLECDLFTGFGEAYGFLR